MYSHIKTTAKLPRREKVQGKFDVNAWSLDPLNAAVNKNLTLKFTSIGGFAEVFVYSRSDEEKPVKN